MWWCNIGNRFSSKKYVSIDWKLIKTYITIQILFIFKLLKYGKFHSIKSLTKETAQLSNKAYDKNINDALNRVKHLKINT